MPARGFVTREREVYDAFGRRRVVPVRTYRDRKGFVLSPKLVFIDGRTGTTLYSERHREEILYEGVAEHTSSLVVLRADGPTPAHVPQRAQHRDDSWDAHAPQVTRPELERRRPRGGSHSLYSSRAGVVRLWFHRASRERARVCRRSTFGKGERVRHHSERRAAGQGHAGSRGHCRPSPDRGRSGSDLPSSSPRPEGRWCGVGRVALRRQCPSRRGRRRRGARSEDPRLQEETPEGHAADPRASEYLDQSPDHTDRR